MTEQILATMEIYTEQNPDEAHELMIRLTTEDGRVLHEGRAAEQQLGLTLGETSCIVWLDIRDDGTVYITGRSNGREFALVKYTEQELRDRGVFFRIFLIRKHCDVLTEVLTHHAAQRFIMEFRWRTGHPDRCFHIRANTFDKSDEQWSERKA